MLAQRGISYEDIAITIRAPTHRERLLDEANKWIFTRRTRGKDLEVVGYWLREENTFIVKTAYFV